MLILGILAWLAVGFIAAGWYKFMVFLIWDDGVMTKDEIWNEFDIFLFIMCIVGGPIGLLATFICMFWSYRDKGVSLFGWTW